MTTYVLSLTGNEEKVANATHWARFRRAKLLCVSRKNGERETADARRTSVAGAAHRPVPRPTAPGTHDPEVLAGLLVRTLDLQDGMGVVLADFDNEEFAADVMAGIAALGRAVTCAGQMSDFASGARAGLGDALLRPRRRLQAAAAG